jgi:hypothetical protein
VHKVQKRSTRGRSREHSKVLGSGREKGIDLKAPVPSNTNARTKTSSLRQSQFVASCLPESGGGDPNYLIRLHAWNRSDLESPNDSQT